MAEFYEEGICKSVRRYEKWLNLNGDYDEQIVKSYSFQMYIIKFLYVSYLFAARWKLLSEPLMYLSKYNYVD